MAALDAALTFGDLTDAALDAVVTTAEGYLRRRRQDSLAAVDDRGNRNLVDAARAAGGSRFVCTSILTCD